MYYENLGRSVATAPEKNDYRRQAERAYISLYGEVRQSGGEFRKVKFVDLSSSGFRMYFLSPLRLNEMIRVKFPGMTPLNARICWSNVDNYGCAFENPLYPSIWENLVRQYQG